MNRIIAALLAAPFTSVTLVGVAAAAPPALDVHVVDSAGLPVPAITIEFVEQPVGAFGVPDLPMRLTSDEAGVIATEGLKREPLDLRIVATDGEPRPWAIRFVHGARFTDETAGIDLLGGKPVLFDLSQDILCVVEPTGTIHVRVEGATKDARFIATFVDRRPEPDSHRNVVSTGTFTGPEGTLHVPAGRGTLYLAQEGFLGAPVVTRDGPLMVSVTAGGSADVQARFLDGATARLLAPFDSIPFRRIEALAPDGRTVVAEFAFEASPLRIKSRLAVVAGSAGAPEVLPTLRLPKHLLRAQDVPLRLPALENPDPTAAERYIDRAPMELIFAVDVGSKMRLPETEGGWIGEAEAGLAIATGIMFRGRSSSGVTRDGTSTIQLASAGNDPQWTARVHVQDDEGQPQPRTEVLIAVPGLLLSRCITDADGSVTVRGIRAETITVALVDSLKDRATLTRPSTDDSQHDEPTVTAQVKIGGRVELQGQWQRTAAQASAGDLLELVPADADELKSRRQFMTRAVPVAFVDAKGTFSFGQVPKGRYTLRAGKSGEATVDLGTVISGSKALLHLNGTGEGFELALTANE